VAKGKRIHGPTPSSPPRRNYSGWTVRVGEGQSLILKNQ